jgi:hypothetical protein
LKNTITSIYKNLQPGSCQPELIQIVFWHLATILELQLSGFPHAIEVNFRKHYLCISWQFFQDQLMPGITCDIYPHPVDYALIIPHGMVNR